MSRSLLRVLMAVALVAGTGLHAAQSAQSPQPQALSMPGYPAPGGPATVSVSSPGNAPRVPLRLKLATGQKETLLMTMKMGISMSADEMSLPAMDMPVMKMWADSAVTAVAPNGDISYDMGFTRLAVETAPGADPNIAKMIEAGASEITSLKGSMVISNRAITKSATLDLTKIGDPNMRQTLGAMSSQFEGLSLPLPEEAVGVGAKWEVRQSISSAGAQLFQRVQCELTALDANSATIKVTTEQTAPAQTISNPAMAGMQMNIEKVSGGGTGTTIVRFGSLTPQSEMTSSTTMNVAVDLGGQMQRMAVKTDIKMSVAPEKK